MTNWLLADIGGTHARFAVLAGSQLQSMHSFDVAAHASAEEAIGRYLGSHARHAVIDGAVIAAAGPVSEGRCPLTNSAWVIDASELKRVFGFSAVDLVNDLEALAWAIPQLAAADTEAIGHGREVAGEPVMVIAPGTGLGMACLVPAGGRVIASEGGHSTLAAADSREAAIIEVLRRQRPHVSAERVLSGPGLENLYAAIAQLEGEEGVSPSAGAITRAALDGSSRCCRQVLDAFCCFLGSFAGNAALMFGARGGVYIGGGIVPRMVGYLRRTAFRTQFEGKGRLRPFLARIPTRVIVRPDPAFLGLTALATRRRPPRQAD